jgi:hypothetical protein
VSARGTRRFIADLLRGRRPRPFSADDADAAQLRAAITLRSARPGSATPRVEFVTDLHQRLAAELTGKSTAAAQTRPGRPVHSSRRRLVQATSIAAAAAAVGAVVDHAITNRVPAESGRDQTLNPTTGQWAHRQRQRRPDRGRRTGLRSRLGDRFRGAHRRSAARGVRSMHASGLPPRPGRAGQPAGLPLPPHILCAQRTAADPSAAGGPARIASPSSPRSLGAVQIYAPPGPAG